MPPKNLQAMIAIDSNVLLRYLLHPIDSNNPRWQAETAESLVNASEKVFISNIVLAETEWVLDGVFACRRDEIYELFHALANNRKFQFENWAVLNCALLDYQQLGKVELSDCLVARQTHYKGASTLYTFESIKKLEALPVVTTLHPPKS